MPKAGYCRECKKNVWLKEDGSGDCGHPFSSMDMIYATEAYQEELGRILAKREEKADKYYMIGLTCGVVGLLVFPIILGPIALIFGSMANNLGRKGYTPIVLGIINIVIGLVACAVVQSMFASLG